MWETEKETGITKDETEVFIHLREHQRMMWNLIPLTRLAAIKEWMHFCKLSMHYMAADGSAAFHSRTEVTKHIFAEWVFDKKAKAFTH